MFSRPENDGWAASPRPKQSTTVSLAAPSIDLPVGHPENPKRPVSAVRRHETLAKVALFRSLNAQQIADLDTQSTWRTYQRNDWIVELDDTGHDVFFIISGTAQLKIPAASGREVQFQDLNAGDYFGDMDAIDGKPRAVGVVALTDVVAARMPREVFRETICRHPEAAQQVLTRLTAIIRILANRVRELSTLDVKHRLYAELLRLSRPRAGEADRAVISPPPVQAAIAARIGTRRETVAREMKALERAGLIERTRGALVLTDTRRLQCMIESVADCDKTGFL
jgi:CRP/FNR family cyclic AMP-dependent transcriptional regulator